MNVGSDSSCVPRSQFPGQFYGGRSGRLHAWQQAQRFARHHTSPDLRSTHPHHLPPGEASEADLPPTTGGGRGAGQQDHFSGPSRDAVFGVRKRLKLWGNICSVCFIVANLLDSSQKLKLSIRFKYIGATLHQLSVNFICIALFHTSNTKCQSNEILQAVEGNGKVINYLLFFSINRGNHAVIEWLRKPH